MADIIKVLPDSVANQIAAGEVIQRPASLVKELMENSVDSGADRVQVIIRDAGRTLVQVVDNGCGMTETDARLCFERHATSKIRQAEDLFAIRTMGFRGEAMASIAAVAQVELKTKTHDSETGTRILINGSLFELQEPAACANGTSISVKNLFYNIPARRKFLKAQSTELKHIITEFQRIALASPGIGFSLHHNDSEIYNLTASRLHERIQHLFGKSMAQILVGIRTETSIVRVTGYVGKPEFAKKTFGEQFFFVNGRFMKHPYLNRAVTSCYEALISPESMPAYFIYLDIDPAQIDVNIHPTKTEIKFEDEKSIYQILKASVREALGKFNLTPSLDFDREGALEMPYFRAGDPVAPPSIRINTQFNPFDTPARDSSRGESEPRWSQPKAPEGWDSLYSGLIPEPAGAEKPARPDSLSFLQIKGKYILMPVKSGVMVINQVRALERIVFEELSASAGNSFPGQKLLYPVTFELNPADIGLLTSLEKDLVSLGFDLEPFGGQSVIVRALPANIDNEDPKDLIEKLLEEVKQETPDPHTRTFEALARKLARISSRSFQRLLQPEEVQVLVDRLFACREPQFTPGGKPVLHILALDELEKKVG